MKKELKTPVTLLATAATVSGTLALAAAVLGLMSVPARAMGKAKPAPQPVPTQTPAYDGIQLSDVIPAGAQILKVYQDTVTNSSTCELKSKLSLAAEEWLLQMQHDRTMNAYFSQIYFAISSETEKRRLDYSSYECSGISSVVGGLFNLLTLGFGELDCMSYTQTNHYANDKTAKVIIFGVQRSHQEQTAVLESEGCAFIKNQDDPRCQPGALPEVKPMTVQIVDQLQANCQ